MPLPQQVVEQLGRGETSNSQGWAWDALLFCGGMPIFRKAWAALRQLAGADEALILSTCNRVEVAITAEDDDSAAGAVRDFLAALNHAGAAPAAGALDGYLYELTDRGAIHHIFRVAASLDSMVLGEPQILGQMKAFAMEDFEDKKFQKETKSYFRTMLTMTRVRNLATPVTEFLSIVAGVAIIWYGGKQVLVTGEMKAAEFLGFLFAIFQVMPPIKELSNVTNRLQACNPESSGRYRTIPIKEGHRIQECFFFLFE